MQESAISPKRLLPSYAKWMFWSRIMVCRQRGGHPRPGWRPQVRQGQVDGPHRRAGRACHDVVISFAEKHAIRTQGTISVNASADAG